MPRSSARLAASVLGLLVPAAAAQVGATTLVSVSSSGQQAQAGAWNTSISPDGRYVAFETHSSDLDPAATPGVAQVYLHDRVTGQLVLASVTPAGLGGAKNSGGASVSENGQFVAFFAWDDALVAGDVNGKVDVVVRDIAAGTSSLVSVSTGGGHQGNGDSRECSISADGRFVAFESEASNLVAGDTNGEADVFLRDRQTGVTTRVSVASDGSQADDESRNPALSLDGQHVAFASRSTNLASGTANGAWNVFVHDVATGLTERVSVPLDGGPLLLQADNAGLSADGSVVAFESHSPNLVAGDTNGTKDVFVRDRAAGVTTRVSVSSSGVEGDDLSGTSQINSFGDERSVSADGRFVVFESEAGNLVPGDTNVRTDIFVHDRETGFTTRVSLDSQFGQGEGHAWLPSVSANGRWVAFESNSDDLVDGDVTPSGPFDSDAFLRDRGPWNDLGSALAGVAGEPALFAAGWLEADTTAGLLLREAAPAAPALLLAALDGMPVPFKGGTLQAFPPLAMLPATTTTSGEALVAGNWPSGVPSALNLRFQWAIADAAALQGVALSRSLEAVTP